MTVKSRILEMFEEHKGETLSGEELAGELGCTRAAVWKAVKALREDGYSIHAGTNRGYSLEKSVDRITEEKLRPYLEYSHNKIQIYNEIKSTNSIALEAAVCGGAGHGDVIFARSQSAGRGSGGRVFYSPADAGIYFSVIVKPETELQNGLLLTAAAAASVYRGVKKVCGIRLDIKWLNELLYHGRKICGILTEAVTELESGNIRTAVIGIGLNFYEPEKEERQEDADQPAGALFASEEKASAVDRNHLAAEIINELLEELRNLKLPEEYIERNIVPGHTINITDKAGTRKAFALSVNPNGRLLVKETNGKKSEVSCGEVSVIG